MPSGITAISDDAFDGASGITIYADRALMRKNMQRNII